MQRHHYAIACLLASLSACAKQAVEPKLESVSLRVAGFVEAAGITWMGWPNAVKEALDGLQGVHEVHVDLADDRFDVRFATDRLTSNDLLAAIRELGFEPEIVTAAAREQDAAATHIDTGALPDDLQQLLADARTREQLLLLQFTGPDWAPCKQMDTVTYPSERVQQELKANWTTIKIDVAQREHVAGICGIHAIPTVLALHPDGRVAGRILGFVAPNVFASQLTELRAK